MSIRDVLLTLVGESSANAITAVEKCTALVRDIGARVSAVAVEEDLFVRPKVEILDSAAASGTIRFMSDTRSLLLAFDAAANRLGVQNDQRLTRLPAKEIPANLAALARLKDLSIVLVKPDDDQSEQIVEKLIFDSGRPVLVCPEEFASKLPVSFDSVVIAWDHTAPAARAVADALPILRAAANVVIITGTDTKSSAELDSGAALVDHLATHGIKASFEPVRIGGVSVGKVLEAYVDAISADLLVMGAYRHSRLNEIIWGGATKTIIGRPPCWVMMSR